MTRRESFGAGDIIQRLISEGGSHWCLAALQMYSELAWEQMQRAGMKGRRLCQAGVGTGSSVTAMGWQTLGEDKGRVQTPFERGRKTTLAKCLRDNQGNGLRAAGAGSQPQPFQCFRE